MLIGADGIHSRVREILNSAAPRPRYTGRFNLGGFAQVAILEPTPDTGEFNGKSVLVTGGTKGAGKAIADRFLRGGGTVMITARSAPEEETGSYFGWL